MTIYELRNNLLTLRRMDNARIHNGELVITDVAEVVEQNDGHGRGVYKLIKKLGEV